MENVNLKVKLFLEKENDKFMGIGVLWLLQNVRTCGSLRAAATGMGMSYSKAFRMVEYLESSLGVPVLDRHKGGSSRGGAVLTRFGEAFTDLYDCFQKKCKKLLDEPFGEFSTELEKLISVFSER